MQRRELGLSDSAGHWRVTTGIRESHQGESHLRANSISSNVLASTSTAGASNIVPDSPMAISMAIILT